MLGSNAIGNLVVNYDNAALTYCGRWTSNANGKYSGWIGSYIKFKVRNTSTIKVNTYCEISNISAVSVCSFYIDQNPNRQSYYYLVTAGATFTGDRNVILPITNDGQWHEIKIYLHALTLADQIGQISKTTLKNLVLDSGGEISTSTIGTKNIQVIGDSWMGVIVNWTRCIDNSSYNVYPVSANGITAANCDTYYDLDFTGITNTTDPNMDAVIISFGVNDKNANVTTGAFQTSLLSVVDKVRLKQPTAKIFLLRVPNNTGASKLYGAYGSNMSTIAGLRSNVVYLDTTSLDTSITWDSDTGHLSANGVLDLSTWVKSQLLANGI